LKPSAGTASEYCPHPPVGTGHEFDIGIYRIGSRFSIHVRDFQSTLDGTVAYAVLFSLLFLSSLASLPTAGLAELYRDSLLRTGLVTALALAIVLVYSRLGAKKKAPRFRVANAWESLLASIVAVLIWAVVWTLFGELSGTYRMMAEPTRLNLVPLAFCVGVLDGLLVYAYCTGKFVIGIGRTMGIAISSLFGWLLFVVVSLDFALYLLPIVVVLTYAAVRSGSPVGPIVVTGLLLGFFYALTFYFGGSVWMLGGPQMGFLLMTLVSVISASLAGLSLSKIPLGGISYGKSPLY
jgi:hypothetical protein